MNLLTQFKKILIVPLLIALALAALASPPVAHADAVTDWNAIASTAIVAPPPVGAGQPPPVSALSFAMIQGAVYDAVNAIDRGHRPYLVQPNANPTDSKAAAATAAAYQVLIGLFPSQQPIAASAAARFSIANRRALAAMPKFWLAASVRKTRLKSAWAWSCQKIAASVWSGVRVVLVSEPSSLTSLKSSAYSALVSAFGPSVRSISALGTMNGRTLPTHGAGSFAKFGGVGRQMPGAGG